MKKLLYILIGLNLFSLPSMATTPVPFICNSESFVSWNEGGWVGADASHLDTISLVNGKRLHADDASGVNGVNSIGYNIKDNMLWGWNIGEEQVVRIDANKNATLYDIAGIPKRFYVAADVTRDGILCLFSRESSSEKKTIVRVDLNTLELLPEVTLDKEINTADFAFNVNDNKLYFVQAGTDDLYAITFDDGFFSNIFSSTISGEVEKVADLGLSSVDPIINFFDKAGNFYFNKDTQNIYKFDVTHKTPTSKATPFSTLERTLVNGDGARCANAGVDDIPTQDNSNSAISVDVVEDFEGNGYTPNSGISVGDNPFTIDAVLLDGNGKVANYHPAQSNNPIPMSVLFYTKKAGSDEDAKRLDGVVTRFQGGKEYATSSEVSPDMLDKGRHEVKVKYLNFYDSEKVNLTHCSGSSLNSTLKGVPACVNGENNYRDMFGTVATEKCFSKGNHGSQADLPCSSGYGSNDVEERYNHPYGCYECTIDALWGSDPEPTTAEIEKDILPIISVNNVSIDEGDSGEKNMIFNLTFSKTPTTPVTFDYKTEDIEAEAGSDYVAKSESGVSTTAIAIPIKGDTDIEPNERFKLVFTKVQGAIYDGNTLEAIGTITNDDFSAFECSTKSYIFSGDYKDDKFSRISNLDIAESKITKIGDYGDSHINAVGYSINDKLMYGVKFPKDMDKAGKMDVVKIDEKFNIQKIGVSYDYIVNYASTLFAMGAVKDDILYLGTLKNDNAIKRVDIKDNKKLSDITLIFPDGTTNLTTADFAFHPNDEKLYFIAKVSDGYRLARADVSNPVNEKVTVELLGHVDTWKNNVTALFDNNGNFYFDIPVADTEKREIYKMELSNPSNIAKEGNISINYIASASPFSSGDGARCNGAYMGDKPIISLPDSANAIEGDSGVSDINITIKSDRPIDTSKMTFSYTVHHGSAGSADYVVNDSGFVLTPSPTNNREYILSLPIIKGDLETEDTENFYIDISSSTAVIEGRDKETNQRRVTATITDNDYNSFIALEPSITYHDNAGAKIFTKVVKKSFKLRFMRLDKRGNVVSASVDENNTQFRFVDPDVPNICSDIPAVVSPQSGFIPFSLDDLTKATADLPSYPINVAMKKVKVQFYWEDRGEKKVSCSPDSFAVRPKAYKIGFSTANIVAGEDFNLTINALAEDNSIVSNYSEPISVISLDINETKAGSGCTLGTFTKEIKPSNFINGVATYTFNYDDIGILEFKVKELNTTEYANVDKDDTADIERFIEKDSSTSAEIKPANISLEVADLKSGGVNNFTYYAHQNDINDMSASQYVKVKVLDASNNPVKNFTSNCSYVEDVNLSFNFKVSNGGAHTMDVEDNGSIHPQTFTSVAGTKVSYTYQITKDLFTNGEGNKTIKLNFGREITSAKLPMKLEVMDINSTLYSLSDAKTPAVKETTFIYARAHAPQNQTTVGKVMNAKVDYEVYLPNSINKATYGLEGLVPSEDDISWYKLPNDPAFGYTHARNKFSGLTITNETRYGMTLTADKVPHKNRIKFRPKSYLMYNMFRSSANSMSFPPTFHSEGAKWSGKGEHGLSIKNDTSKRGSKRLDW